MQASILLASADTIGCVIRDRSEGGFALEVNSVLGIPDAFTLIIPHAGEAFEARVIWKMPRKIGVTAQPAALYC